MKSTTTKQTAKIPTAMTVGILFFYECEKSFEIDHAKFGCEPLKLTDHIVLMI